MSTRRRQQEIMSRAIASCLESDEVAAELQRTVIEQIRKEKTTKVKEMKFLKDRLPKNQRYALDLAVQNKTRTSKVGAISKAQKAQNIFFGKKLVNFEKKSLSKKSHSTENVEGGPFGID